MNKKLALLLSGVMVASVATGCGGTKIVEEKTTTEAVGNAGSKGSAGAKLTVAWWGNQTRNERTQAALDLYTEQNPGITFDGQFSEWSDYWNKLATVSAAHSLPDVVQMDYKYLQQYVDNNLLVDLKPYIDNGTLDVSSVDPGILESGSVNGGIYALCIGVNAPSLFYNKTLLEENGIEIKDNMTTEEFMAVCREVYEKTGYKTNVSYNNGENFIDYVLRGQDIPLFDGNQLGASSAADLEPFFDFYETGREEGWHVDPAIFAERAIGSVEQDPLVYGDRPDARSWCAFFYSNQLTAMKNAAPEGLEIGVTTWPSANPSASNYLKPSQFFSVTVDSKNPEEAVKVLNYVTNSVECNEILLGERGVPASSIVADAIAPKMDEASNVVIKYINEVVTPNSSTINPPAPDGASEVLEVIDRLEEEMFYNKISSKEAAEQLFTRANEILKSK